MKHFDPELTGSIEFQSNVITEITSSITGIGFWGTASWAVNTVNGVIPTSSLSASWAVSASLAQTASYINVTGSGIIVNWNGSELQLTASAGESASYAYTASSAVSSSFAETSSYTVSASYAYTASSAVSAAFAETSSYTVSASYAYTASSAVSSAFAETSSYTVSASYAYTASSAVSAAFAETSSYTVSASYTYTASSAVSASNASTASFINVTGSGVEVRWNGTQLQLTASVGGGGGTLQTVTTAGRTTTNAMTSSGTDMLVNSISIGRGNGFVASNTILGSGSLKCNIAPVGYAQTGTRNTAIGYGALELNTNGYMNTSIGFKALNATVLDRRNTAVGGYTLQNSNGGCFNTAIGERALRLLTVGCCNVAVGSRALYNSTSGCRNTAVGTDALVKNTSGCCNTAVGFRALYENVTGNRNTSIGWCAGPSAGNSSLTNTVAVGYNARTYASNCVRIGNTSIAYASIQVAFTSPSDCRDKTDIKPLSTGMGIDLLRTLKPVEFRNDHRQNYVDKCGWEWGTRDGSLKSSRRNYGLVAQEVSASLAELGIEYDGLLYDDKKDAYTLSYTELIPSLIQAIKQLDEENKEIKARLTAAGI